MTRTLLVLMLLTLGTACSREPAPLDGPVVYLHLNGDWTDEEIKWVDYGAAEWTRLGFDVRPVGEAYDPAVTILSHYDRTSRPDLSTAILLEIYHDPAVADAGAWGYASTSRRDIRLRPGLARFDLMGTVAHEMGHQLLNQPNHLPAGQTGVMAGPDGFARSSLTADDLAFACAAPQGRCVGQE